MKYLFFVSWFRAKEKNLADQTDLDRMIGASSLEESFKVLNDTDYSGFLSGRTYQEIEQVISLEKQNLRKTLEQMGMDKPALDFLFLKNDLIMLAGEIKEKKLNSLEKSVFIDKYSDLARKLIEKKEIDSLEQIDDLVINYYFKKAIRFCQTSQENQLADIFKKYWLLIKNKKNQDLKTRDDLLIDMENKIIEKSREKIDGIMPILAFFIKKTRAQYFVKTVLSAKRIGLSSTETYSLIEKTRTL
jgi:hypothetical protein